MSDWGYRATCAELASRGFRDGEPGGMPHFEQSRVFPYILRSKTHGTVTGKRIATELHVPVADVRTAMLESEIHVVEEQPRSSTPEFPEGRDRNGAANSGRNHKPRLRAL